MIDTEIDTEDQNCVVCPYCGYRDPNSWELTHASNDINCGACGNEFSYEREIIVTYSTRKKEETAK